jgi:hypothetical protein
VCDRAGVGEDRIRFTSAIMPPYARYSRSLEVLIPILYLKGIATDDFEEVLAALRGKDNGELSAGRARSAAAAMCQIDRYNAGNRHATAGQLADITRTFRMGAVL